MNKNGDIPSGVQLVDLLDKLRLDAFEAKDAQRRVYLDISRKRTAKKKLEEAVVADAEKADDMESGDENEIESVKKVNENSPSKPRVMPEDYIPLHFLSWLKLGQKNSQSTYCCPLRPLVSPASAERLSDWRRWEAGTPKSLT